MPDRIKIENVEDRQLPRWVYAMMKANQDPNEENFDSPKLHIAKLKAEEFYKARQSRLAESAEASSRITGLEWKTRPKTTFTAEEMKKIRPGGAVYVANKTFFMSFVMAGVVAATLFTLFLGLCVCAELKLSVSAKDAWDMFLSSPSSYFHHVINAFDW